MIHFIEPIWLLWSLPTLGVVWWLHRRPSRSLPLVRFGAMRFIQSIYTGRRTTRKLAHRLLLLLRLLLILLLFGAFASPVWHAGEQRSTGRATAVIVDATASMCRMVDDKKVWVLAKDQAIDWMAQHRAEPVMLYVLTDQLRPLLDEPTLNHAYLAQTLGQLDVSYARGRLDQLRSLTQWDKVQHVHVFTDGQATGFPASQVWHQMLGSRGCQIHIITDKPMHNVAITQIKCMDISDATGHVADLHLTVTQTGGAMQQVPLHISVDGRTIKQDPIQWRDSHGISRSTAVRVLQPGAAPARVRLDVMDDIAWDNVMNFVIPRQIQPAVRTLGNSDLLIDVQRLFEADNYKLSKSSDPLDTLLIASPSDSTSNPQIQSYLASHGSVMWLLHDEASAGAFAQFAKASFPDTLPGHWETRQTFAPAFWKWAWDQTDWLDVFQKGYETPLMHLASSRTLAWAKWPKTPWSAAAWHVLATCGNEPVVMWRWDKRAVLLLVVMPTADLEARLDDPAMLSLLLHLGNRALFLPHETQVDSPGNPVTVGYRWSPDAKPPAVLTHRLGNSQTTESWDGKPITLTMPGMYTLSNSQDTTQRDAMIASRVATEEYATPRIDPPQYNQAASQTATQTASRTTALWPIFLALALVLAGVEAVYAYRLREKGGVDG